MYSGKLHYTSCTRFGEESAITQFNRPFTNAEEMDAEIIRRWNEVVGENDEVWHLGDFGNFSKVKQLNGHINIMLSEADVERLKENDDYDEQNPEEYIEWVLEQMGFNEVYMEGSTVELNVNEGSIPERYRGYKVSHEHPDKPCIGGGRTGFAVVGEYNGQKKRCVDCTLYSATDLWNFAPFDEGDLLVYFLDLEDQIENYT